MNWESFVAYDNLINIGIALGIFLLFLLFRKLFAKYIFAILLKISKKAPTDLLENIFLSYKKPFQWLFIIIGIYIAADYFPYIERSDPLFLKIMRSSVIFIISWGLFNLSSTSSLLFKKLNEKYNFKIDAILIPILSKTIQIIIVAISITIIAQEFDYDVNGFVAGLGLGGLAFALAAKDALSNLFGGIVIITEKPFSIGDWIKTPSVEGTVEDITFRSTKIRTFAHALVTVPNATLANENITNWSKMGKRRITFNLELSGKTSKEQLKKVLDQIESLLKHHPEIHQETIFIRFDGFTDNGFTVFFYFFTKTINWGEFLKIKEEINFEIMEILENEDVSIAYPSRTLFVESRSDKENNNGNEKLYTNLRG